MFKQTIMAVFLITALLININNVTDAADVKQKFSSSLSAWYRVINDGPSFPRPIVSTTIDCTSGNLVDEMNPRFRFISNVPFFSASWTMYAEIEDDASTSHMALYGPTGIGNQSIMLANTADPPSAAAISDITSGTLTNNPNVIAYPASYLLGSGALIINSVTYNAANNYYDIESQGAGTKRISLIIGQTHRTGTYSAMDSPGPYVATVTMQLGTP